MLNPAAKVKTLGRIPVQWTSVSFPPATYALSCRTRRRYPCGLIFSVPLGQCGLKFDSDTGAFRTILEYFTIE